ncbi:hypothetical protein D1AOALGA4SA_8185 [Olavius algarvensis Delta 1 endosymbiont]|nr:hypothetical protein D1AOALGA4SA_8185 [Olavius algarvensis Delta 1 endosymbiont]
MKIFAIGAHFDDVEIGCGGTLLRRAAEGDQIFILTVTNSEYSKPNGGPKRRGNVAKAEAQEAAKILGAELICLNKPCLDLIHNEELVYDIEDVVQEVKPDILLTHWGGGFSLRSCSGLPFVSPCESANAHHIVISKQLVCNGTSL